MSTNMPSYTKHKARTHIQTETAGLLALDVDSDKVVFDLTVHKWDFERIWKFVGFFNPQEAEKHK